MIKNLKIQVKPVKNFGEISKSLSHGDQIDVETLAGMQVLKLSVTVESDVETITKVVKFINGLSEPTTKK